jgi:hypothetical protein
MLNCVNKNMTCQICDGQQKILGYLGDRMQLRCVNCGMDSSKSVLIKDYLEDDDLG